VNKIGDPIKWIYLNFFPLIIPFFIFIYLRWYRLTPLELDDSYNDPNEAYMAGLVLLGAYVLFATLDKLIRNYRLLKIIISILAFLLLGINIVHVFFFLPRITATAKCNGKSYYISNNFGTLTNFWSYDQLTVWENNLDFKSHFFGYGGTSYEIICDEAKKEVNIIIPYLEALDYTDGKSPRSYIHTSAILNNQLYVLSEDWFIPEACDGNGYWDCDTFTYTLYECKTDYTSCDSLPIQYTTKYENFAYLESDEINNEINLYNTDDDTLIFTYGEHPRCYVEGCEILK